MNTLNNFFVYPINQWPFIFVVLVIAFTFHEFSHAYFANIFGDPTAKKMGRVTLNPKVHLDLLGTVLIFIAGFGWAKPVPVNRNNFKYPRLMGVIVSLVGPLSNLLIAFFALFLLYLLKYSGWLDHMSVGVLSAIDIFFVQLIELNLILFLFNLIPLPPLDGYRVIEDLAPLSLRERMRRLEQWAVFIFLLIVIIPPLGAVTIGPLFSLRHNILFEFNQIMILIFGKSLMFL